MLRRRMVRRDPHPPDRTHYTAAWLLLASVLCGIAVATAASHLPIETCTLLFGCLVAVALLRAGAKAAKRGLEKELLTSDFRAGEAVTRHGRLFRLWFDMHNLLWAEIALSASCALLGAFGPSNRAMSAMAAFLSCACFALLGDALRARSETLALCWRVALPQPDSSPRKWLDYAGIVMVLRRRRDYARECDWVSGGFVNLGVLEIRERARVGRDSRFLPLWEKKLERNAVERLSRAAVLASVFACALVAAWFLLPYLAGNATLPPLREILRAHGPFSGVEKRSAGERVPAGSQPQPGRGAVAATERGDEKASASTPGGSPGSPTNSATEGGGNQRGGQGQAGKEQPGAAGEKTPQGQPRSAVSNSPIPPAGAKLNPTGAACPNGKSGGARQGAGAGSGSSANEAKDSGATGGKPGTAQAGSSQVANKEAERKATPSEVGKLPGHGRTPPRIGATPVVLPPLPHDPGQIVDLKLPSDPHSRDQAGGEPGPLKDEAGQPGKSGKEPPHYRPVPESKAQAREPGQSQPVQHWPNWIFSLLHK